jgi:hypothetical protein
MGDNKNKSLLPRVFDWVVQVLLLLVSIILSEQQNEIIFTGQRTRNKSATASLSGASLWQSQCSGEQACARLNYLPAYTQALLQWVQHIRCTNWRAQTLAILASVNDHYGGDITDYRDSLSRCCSIEMEDILQDWNTDELQYTQSTLLINWLCEASLFVEHWQYGEPTWAYRVHVD